jgi:hypothetical protein
MNLLEKELKDKVHNFMKLRGWRTCSTLALFWADGKRTVLDIWRMLRIEHGQVDLKSLIEWFYLLEKMDFVKIEKA